MSRTSCISAAAAAVIDTLEPRRMFAAHPVAINFCDEALWDEHFDTAVSQAKQLGVTSVRVWMGYDSLNERPNVWDPVQPFGAISSGELPPDTPRSNNAGRTMRRLFQLKDEGFHVMVILNDSQGDAPDSAAQVKGYIRHLMDSPEVPGGAETLKDAVDLWQIGNEVDSATYWKPSASNKTAGIQRYVNELLIPAAEELKTNANEEVVSAGPSWNTGDLSLILTTAKNAGKLSLIDYAGYHPYGTYDPTIPSSVNQIKERSLSALAVGNGFGKKLIASEWNVRGFGNAGANDAKWVQAMDEVYRTAILPNFEIAYYFQLINNWPARGGTVSARPGGLLKHDTTIQVTPSSPVLDLRDYYQAPLVIADPFYSTFMKWQEGSVSGVVVNASATHAGTVVPPVTVYADIDSDGLLDENEPSALTDEAGAFKLQFTSRQFAAGNYKLRTVLPEGWTEATPLTNVAFSAGISLVDVQVSLLPPGDVQVRPGSIGGTLWNDGNGDGIFGANESVTGVRQVFIDVNGNGVLDRNEPTTSSDVNGAYRFVGLVPGTYNISRVFPAGYRISNSAQPYIAVTIAPGQEVDGINIGTTNLPITTTPKPVTTGSLSGRVWNDTDGDGLLDSDESGIAGRLVWVDFDNDSLFDSNEPSAISGADGSFIFNYDTALITTGEFAIRQLLPVDWALTNVVPVIPIGAGRADNGVLLGSRLVRSEPPEEPEVTIGLVSGTHYLDTNANGVRDEGELPIVGRDVFLDLDRSFAWEPGEPIATTDENGDFTLIYDTNLIAAGTYRLGQRLPAGWSQTVGTPQIAVGAGNAQTGLLIGSYPVPVAPEITTGSLAGRVWQDADADNVIDGDETGISGRIVYIDLNDNSTFDAGEPSALTDAAGQYLIAYDTITVAAGTYALRSVLPSEWESTGLAPTVTVGAGRADTGFNLGSRQTPPPAPVAGSIAGRVWNDGDASQTLNGEETGLSGRIVFIDLDADGLLDSNEPSAQTNAAGEFVIDYNTTVISAGVYALRQQLPTGWEQTTAAVSVTVAGGRADTGALFGARVIPPVVEPPVDQKNASITGILWNDGNGDGVFDAGESRTGVRQVFIDTNGNKKLDAGEISTMSDAQGNYRFSGLAAGTYNIARVFPTGFRMSNSATGLQTITVSAGQQVTNVHIGTTDRPIVVVPPVTPVKTGVISGVQFNDLNGNGVRDTGESAISGREVFIDLNGNYAWEANEPRAVTDASGQFTITYDTTIVPVGSYRLGQRLPSGWSQTVGTPLVTLAAGKTESGLLIGSRDTNVTPPTTDPRTGSISGFLWNDGNGNGKVDSNDARTGARQVFIDTNGNKKLDAGEVSMMSDAQGNFSFTGLAAGTYNICRVFPAGFRMSNSSTGLLAITIAAGEKYTAANIGTTDRPVA